jgi:nitrogen-specific signal transduction histidine kinase
MGLYKYIYLIIIVFEALLGLIPVLYNPKKIYNLAFCVSTVAMVFWTFCVYMYKVSTYTLFWAKMAFIGPIIVPFTLAVFCIYYPKKDIHVSVRHVLVVSLLPIIFLGLIPTSFIVKSADIYGNLIYGVGHKLFAVYFILLSITAFVFSIKDYNTYKGLDRLKVKYFFLSILAVAFAMVPNLILPLLGFNVYSHMGPFFLIFFVGFNIYAMTKHRLLDIRIIINKTLATIITLLFFSLIYWFISYNFLDNSGFFYNEVNVVVLGVYWLVVALVFHQVRLKVQTTAVVALLKGGYDYQEILFKFTKMLGGTVEKDALLENVKRLFREELEIVDVLICMPRDVEGESCDAEEGQLCEGIKSVFSKEDEDALFKIFKEKKEIVYTGELDEKNRGLMESVGFEVFVPCITQGQIVASIIFGSKLSEDAYTEEDFELFRAVSAQMSVALKRIDPYERVKADYKKSLAAAESIAQQAAYATLTRGIAHEINNPLGMILSGVELIQDNIENQESVVEYSEMVSTTIDRLFEIADTLLRYGDASEGRQESLSINYILDDVILMAGAELKKRNISVVKNFVVVPRIKGNSSALTQAFLNMVINAIQAIDSVGTINLTTEVGTFFDRRGEEKEGIRVELRDTGGGVSADKIGKIFDPFFSTKYTNTGLGLSVVMRTLSDHNGMVDVKSTEGVGTVFLIHFPLDEKKGGTR